MLDIDTFDGSAWLAVVPFTMSGVRARFTPALPGPGAFHELNLRTYVTHEGKPGVWFFSLDAASRLGVETARRTFHLAYFNARMSLSERDGGIAYESQRTDSRGKSADLSCWYQGEGPPERAGSGSLESFLTDRYRLFASDLPPRSPERLWIGEIDHDPWLLSRAVCEVEHNSLASPIGVSTPANEAILHLAEPVSVRAWWPTRAL